MGFSWNYVQIFSKKLLMGDDAQICRFTRFHHQQLNAEFGTFVLFSKVEKTWNTINFVAFDMVFEAHFFCNKIKICKKKK